MKTFLVLICILLSPNVFSVRVFECGLEKHKSGTNGDVCGWKTASTSSCAKDDDWGLGDAGVLEWEKLRSLSCPGAENLKRYYVERPGACKEGDFFDKSTLHCDTSPIGEEVNCRYVNLCVDYEVVPLCRTPESKPLRFKSCEHPDHGAKTCEDPIFGDIYFDCADFDRNDIDNLLNTVVLVETLSDAYIALEGSLISSTSSRNSIGCTIRDYEDNPLANRSGIIMELKDIFDILFGEIYSKDTVLQCGEFDRTKAIPEYTDDCPNSNTQSYCDSLKAYNRSKNVLTDTYGRSTAMFSDIIASKDQSIESKLKGFICSEDAAFGLLSVFNFNCEG